MTLYPILTVCVQMTLVAVIGLLGARLSRSAAHRHSVLFAALFCILAAPLFYAGTAWSGFSLSVGGLMLSPATITGEFHHPWFRPTTYVRAVWILGGIWLIGSLFSLLGVLRSQLKAGGILRTARPVARSLKQNVIAQAEQSLNAVGPLRVATTGKVAGPVVMGVCQPWILIPTRYLETLSREELLQVLIHEGAHALRRDPLVALLQRIVCALYWWHPLVHMVNRELTRAREEVCDNFVLICTAPETYGTTLLRLALLSPAMARYPSAVGMFDGREKLSARIERLLDRKRMVMTRVRFVTALTVLGAFGLFSVLIAATRGDEISKAEPGEIMAAVTKDAQKVAAEPVEAIAVKRVRPVLQFWAEYSVVTSRQDPGPSE
jgi:beta-lactamase regulating signal transducer with metallopeptidase domain